MKATHILKIVVALILALTLVNGVAVLLGPSMQAAEEAEKGDLFSNGSGEFVCVCGEEVNCRPCGDIEAVLE